MSSTWVSAICARVCAGLLGVAFVLAPPCRAQSEAPSAVVELSVAPSAVVAETTLSAIPAGSRVVVYAVERVGDVTRVTLRASADGALATIDLAADAAGHAALAAGSVLTVTAHAGGWLLESGVDVVAFVPNALGRELLHHEELHREELRR